MKRLNKYIIEKFKISKDVKQVIDREDKEELIQLAEDIEKLYSLFISTYSSSYSFTPEEVCYNVLNDLFELVSNNYEDPYFNGSIKQLVKDFKKELSN